MKKTSIIKNIVIGIIFVLIIVTAILVFLKFFNLNKLHPSVKSTFSRVPFLKNNITSQQLSETEKNQKVFEEEKKKNGT